MSRRLISNCLMKYTSRNYSQHRSNSLAVKLVNEFDKYVPKIIDDCLARAEFIESEEMKNRIKKSTEYYTVGRRPVQGEFMVYAYESLDSPKHISDEFLVQLQAIITALEIVQSYAYIWDDYEDKSKLRCGKVCWHLVDDNDALALVDACIIRSFMEDIVIQNTKGKLRDQVLNILSKSYYTGSMGQYLDASLARSKNYERFTIEQYNLYNNLKSSFYAVKVPILLGLAISNKLDKKSFRIVDDCCTDIGIMIHVHNDLIDYFNTKGAVKGKTGTDIQEGKCSLWAIEVLHRGSPEQRRIFTENYGSWDPEKLDRILQLYEQIDVVKVYKREEEARYNSFYRKIKDLPKDAIPSADFFLSFYNLMRQYTKDISSLMYHRKDLEETIDFQNKTNLRQEKLSL